MTHDEDTTAWLKISSIALSLCKLGMFKDGSAHFRVALHSYWVHGEQERRVDKSIKNQRKD